MVSTIIIILFVLFIKKRDAKRFGKLVSPSICFLFPTFVITVLYHIVGPMLGFYELNKSIYTEILISTFFFFLGGEVACKIMILRFDPQRYGYIISNIKSVVLQSKFYILVAFAVLLLFLKIYTLGGLNVLMSPELQAQYGSSGLFGHLMVFSIFSIIILLSLHFSTTNKLFSYLLLFCSFICVVFYQVKSWLIFPIIVSVLYKQCVGIKQSYWKYLGAILAIIACFILGYAFTYSLDDSENQLFILNHFLKYVFAGVGGWSEAINDGYMTGQNPAYLLQPFSHFLGIEQASVDSRYEFVLINDNGEYTNVYTLIGTSLLFAGRFWAYIYFFILGVVSYLVACRIIRRPNTGILLAYAVLCTSLFLGFFGSYFTLLNIYELIFYSYIIQYVVKKKGLYTTI